MKQSIASLLSGGNPRSLGRAEEIVTMVLSNKKLAPELFNCLFDRDEIVRMRAGDALEKICRQNPVIIQPFTDRLLSEVATINQPSVQWHLMQMTTELKLNDAQYKIAIAIINTHLSQATDWIVLNTAIDAMAHFAISNPLLVPDFIISLQRLTQSHHKSVAKRARLNLEKFTSTN